MTTVNCLWIVVVPYSVEKDKDIVYDVQFGLLTMVLGRIRHCVKETESNPCSKSEGSNHSGEKLKGRWTRSFRKTVTVPCMGYLGQVFPVRSYLVGVEGWQLWGFLSEKHLTQGECQVQGSWGMNWICWRLFLFRDGAASTTSQMQANTSPGPHHSPVWYFWTTWRSEVCREWRKLMRGSGRVAMGVRKIATKTQAFSPKE